MEAGEGGNRRLHIDLWIYVLRSFYWIAGCTFWFWIYLGASPPIISFGVREDILFLYFAFRGVYAVTRYDPGCCPWSKVSMGRAAECIYRFP